MKRKIRRRRQKMTIPLGVVLGFAPFAADFAARAKQHGFVAAVQRSPSRFLPYDFVDRRFTTDKLHLGLYPVLGGIMLHKFIGGSLGVNRMLARMGVPLIRI